MSSYPAAEQSDAPAREWVPDDQWVPASADASTRVGALAAGTDVAPVARLLRDRREQILRRWLSAVGLQPFARGLPERIVADHVPVLLDALIALLERHHSAAPTAAAPLEDPAVSAAARTHARERLEQGLRPVDVLTEFRLLRQEIGRALRRELLAREPDSPDGPLNPEGDAPAPSEVAAAQLLVHDALDGAVALALAALSEDVDAALARLHEELDLRTRVAEARAAFVSSITHDVKTPLTAAQGTADLLRSQVLKGALDPDYLTTRLGRVVRSITAAVARLDQLLDVAVGEEGQPLPLELERLDLVEVVLGQVELFRGASDPHVLRVDAGPQELVGRFDRTRVERAVENLLSNAFKYSPDGGEVLVRVCEDHGPDGRWAIVEVSDHGIGIPADQLGQVFQRFVRARNAVEAGIQGSGIGLCGVRQTVEQHGGRVEAASEEGRGSTFTLRLPLAAP